MTDMFDCRNAWAETMIELAQADPRVVVVVNDSLGSSNLQGFADRFPDRVINVGIAEQTMVGAAAGLADAGYIPFVSAAACFLTARAMEQIKVDVGYAAGNVKLCGMSPGMAYGELGPTHHSIEDMSWLRAIPGITIIVPADPVETAATLRWMASSQGPAFIRVSRMAVRQVFDDSYEFRPGRGTVVRDGSDVTVIANGVLLQRALGAAETLAPDVSVRVVSMPTVSSLDEDLVVRCAAETTGIVTLEEGQVSGGLGAAVACLLAQRHPARMRILGVPGVFAPTGSQTWLLDHFGMDNDGICRAILDLAG